MEDSYSNSRVFGRSIEQTEVAEDEPAPTRIYKTAPAAEDVVSKAPFADPLFESEINSMGEAWAVPWSDLMMVMFIVFAALYILDLSTPEIIVEYRPEPVQEQIEIPAPVESPVEIPVPGTNRNTAGVDTTNTLSINVFEESNEALQRAELSDVKVALLSDQSVKVSVQGPMLFELGKADLRDEVTEFLDSLAFVIRQTPFRVRVIGHTDDKPINTTVFPSNWELSLYRASTVARYLINAGEIDPTRFTVMGRGQYEPVASNSDADARALNRRVEIIITREKNAALLEQFDRRQPKAFLFDSGCGSGKPAWHGTSGVWPMACV